MKLLFENYIVKLNKKETKEFIPKLKIANKKEMEEFRHKKKVELYLGNSLYKELNR